MPSPTGSRSRRRACALNCAASALSTIALLAICAQSVLADPSTGSPAAPAPAIAPATPAPKPAPKPPTAADLLSGRLQLGDGRQIWHPVRKQIGFSLAPGIAPSTTADQAKFTIDNARLVAYLRRIKPYVDRTPVNAHPAVLAKYARDQLYISNISTYVPCKIIPERDGGALLVDQAAVAIEQAVASSPTVEHIVLPLKPWPASVTTANLTGIDARLGHFVTRFNPGEVGRTETVRRAIDLIDGHIVAPGAIFSVNGMVGERTAQRGFGSGFVFINGHMEMQLGGGMCQVATTLFNSILLAGLKVVERHQHVRTVPYVKAGSDATVYWGAKDFKFQNDTQTPVYISYHTTATHAICDIFGKAVPGRTIKIVARQERLGPRHYTGSIARIVTENGKSTTDYIAHSAYQWPPSLDYSR